MKLPIPQKDKEAEWTTILGIAKNNGFPRNNIERLKENLIKKGHQLTDKEPTKSKWIPFTYFGPEVRRITNLFKSTNVKIAFRTINRIQQQLAKQPHKKTPVASTKSYVIHVKRHMWDSRVGQ